jgi:hypothetical protein
VTTSVGKTRVGVGLYGEAGGHLRRKFVTIGLSIDTGSPYEGVNLNVNLPIISIILSLTCLIIQSMASGIYNLPSSASRCVGCPKCRGFLGSYGILHNVPYEARLHRHSKIDRPLLSFATLSATMPLHTTSWGSGATRTCKVRALALGVCPKE